MPTNTGVQVRIGSPATYDPSAKTFTQGGRKVSRQAVRGEIDKLSVYVEKEMTGLAKRYAAGGINIAEFEIGMKDLLRSSHIIAASVGRGGRLRMTLSDWGTVGNRLKFQYESLAGWMRLIERKSITDPLKLANRARLYASSFHPIFYKMVLKEHDDPADTRPKVMRVLNAKESCPGCLEWAAKGWISVDAMPEIGDLDCQQFCKCDLLFEDDV